MTNPILSFSPETWTEISKLVRAIGDKYPFAIAFNFARTVSVSSRVGQAILQDASATLLGELAEAEGQAAMGSKWTLELVSYERTKLPDAEIHTIQGVPFFIPSDLEDFFRGKTVEFRNNEFYLV